MCSWTCCCAAVIISALHGALAIIILYHHKIYYYLAGTPQHKNCVDYLPYHKTISSVKLITQTRLPLQLCFCLLDISDSKIHKLTWVPDCLAKCVSLTSLESVAMYERPTGPFNFYVIMILRGQQAYKDTHPWQKNGFSSQQVQTQWAMQMELHSSAMGFVK